MPFDFGAIVSLTEVPDHTVDNCIQEHASLVTTEISQVPLSGVKALLDVARYVRIVIILRNHLTNTES